MGVGTSVNHMGCERSSDYSCDFFIVRNLKIFTGDHTKK